MAGFPHLHSHILWTFQCFLCCIPVQIEQRNNSQCIYTKFQMDIFLFFLFLRHVMALDSCVVSSLCCLLMIYLMRSHFIRRCAHLTGYNMQWASTVKEVELSHFFKEWPAMWRRFWGIWIVSWAMILGVAFMASSLARLKIVTIRITALIGKTLH